MKRLEQLEQQLVAKSTENSQKKPLDFQYFRNLSKIDKQ